MPFGLAGIPVLRERQGSELCARLPYSHPERLSRDLTVKARSVYVGILRMKLGMTCSE